MSKLNPDPAGEKERDEESGVCWSNVQVRDKFQEGKRQEKKRTASFAQQ